MKPSPPCMYSYVYFSSCRAMWKMSFGRQASSNILTESLLCCVGSAAVIAIATDPSSASSAGVLTHSAMCCFRGHMMTVRQQGLSRLPACAFRSLPAKGTHIRMFQFLVYPRLILVYVPLLTRFDVVLSFSYKLTARPHSRCDLISCDFMCCIFLA